MGIGVGLYIVFICVTGSAVVLRPQINLWFVDSRVSPTEAGPISAVELEAVIANVYGDYEVLRITPPRFPNRATNVLLSHNGEEFSHYFNPYTGEDQGTTYPWQVAAIEQLVALHDDLWLGRTGRKINGIGGALFLLMVSTGLIVWWQGSARWKNSLTIKPASNRSFAWQLHSFIGFWAFILMFCWGLSAVYFAFPEPFESFIDLLDDDMEDFERPDSWLLFLVKIHFGRFGDLWGRLTWVMLGLLPAVMFITGFILWWQRVVRKELTS